MKFHLCLNCLESGARDVIVGGEKGHQMDRYHDTVALCSLCEAALLIGDFATLSRRYTEERTVKVNRNATS